MVEDLLGKVAPSAADPEAFARGWRELGELQEEESQELGILKKRSK